MEEPDENVVAQVRWLSQRFSLPFDPFLLRVRRGFEARAERARQTTVGRLCGYAEWWLWDEPFAVRPGHIGSFLASEIIGDQVRAEGFARQALVANKEDPTAINNLICVLAMQNKVEEAEKIELGLPRLNEPIPRAVQLATQGLVLFRRGRVREGRKAYGQSIDELARLKQTEKELLARIHFLHEEEAAGDISTDDLQKSKVELGERVRKSGNVVLKAISKRLINSRQLYLPHKG